MISLPVLKGLKIGPASLAAVVSVAVAVALRSRLGIILGSFAPWTTFYCAVFLSAWAGGFRPGLLATLQIRRRYPPRLSPKPARARPRLRATAKAAFFKALPMDSSFLIDIRPDIKVIVCSGYSEAEALHRFSRDGLDGFLHKPYTSTQLAEKVRQVSDLV